VSAALDLLAALVLEDGRRWGEAAVEFQWQDARAVLDKDGPPYNFLTRSRGAAKTSDLAGITVAAMLSQAPMAAKLYGLAADRDQGRLLLDSIDGYRARTPQLAGALRVDAFRVTATRSGATLDVLAADAPGAWGLRPWLLIVDELAQWSSTGAPRRLWDAAATAVAKLAEARMAVLTTAGDPAHWSRKVLDHALTDPLWRVHEVRGPAPWLDAERLAEQRRRLLDSTFRRLFWNEWTSAEDRLASDEDLRACVTLDGPLDPQPGRRYMLGLDLGLKRDRTVAAVAHAERPAEPGASPRVALDRMGVWTPTRDRPVQLVDVERWVVEAARTYPGTKVILDPWQAIGLAQRLRSRGVQVEEFTFHPGSVGRLAATLHLLIKNRALDLPDDPELLDELANVRLAETSPGIVRMQHDPDRHDDRAIALALAAHRLLAVPVAGPGGARVGGTRAIRDALDPNPSPLRYGMTL
jgi:hypothetical protein